MASAFEKNGPRISLICGGLQRRRLRLQPWHYCLATANQLHHRGCRVTIISNETAGGDNAASYGDLPVHRLPSISNPRWRSNRKLQQAIEASAPDVILWHLGLASFLHQRYSSSGRCPIVGIFTSPVYTRPELAEIGWKRLLRSWRQSGIQVSTTLTPRRLLNKAGRRNPQMDLIVVQTNRTREALVQGSHWEKEIRVIPPAAGDCWHQPPREPGSSIREKLGFALEDTVLVFFGSPAPIRGLHALVQAFSLLVPHRPRLRLLILSRQSTDGEEPTDYRLRQLLGNLPAEGKIFLAAGMLDEAALRDFVAASDVVALPFALITSDAPISLLEAQAAGKPIVSLATGCVPELVGADHPGLVRGYDTAALAESIANLCDRLDVSAADGRIRHDWGLPPGRRRTWQDVGAEWTRLLAEML